MKLLKKQTTNEYVIPKDLSVSAIGMLNSLLVKSNDELENVDLYSLSNDSRKDDIDLYKFGGIIANAKIAIDIACNIVLFLESYRYYGYSDIIDFAVIYYR